MVRMLSVLFAGLVMTALPGCYMYGPDTSTYGDPEALVRQQHPRTVPPMEACDWPTSRTTLPCSQDNCLDTMERTEGAMYVEVEELVEVEVLVPCSPEDDYPD